MHQRTSSSRRNLLRGRLPSAPPPLRPPGAIVEALFVERCTACADCIGACPQGILTSGSGGFPEVDFSRAECTFCERCIDACEPNALRHDVQPPWQLQLVVREHCLARQNVICESCRDACDADAVRFRLRLGAVAIPEIDASACTGCGACIAACPETAIEAIYDGRR